MRILFGFVVACIVAGAVTVLFIDTPVELAQLAGIPLIEKLTDRGILALRVATHSAIFAAPFALIAILVAEWAHLRNWLYYAVVGMVIAALGFILQYSSEIEGQRTIVNNYATVAYLTTGFLGGVAYWLFSGRRAGGPQADPEFIYDSTATSPLAKSSAADKSREATTEIREKTTAISSTTNPESGKTATSGQKDRGTSVPVTARPSTDPKEA